MLELLLSDLPEWALLSASYDSKDIREAFQCCASDAQQGRERPSQSGKADDLKPPLGRSDEVERRFGSVNLSGCW